MMQTLLVDLGNTRLKWAMLSDDSMQASSGLMHREKEFAVLLVRNAW
jgi:pantothenate kinase type III